jgi:DNA-binding MarR family transcriptional regulator
VISENESTAELILGLHRATHATLHALTARFAALGLSASEINALANLAQGPARRISALAAATATRPTTLTSVLDRLERRGYVARDLDPADRRSFLISLTPAGRPIADAVYQAVRTLGDRALGTISATDRAGFRAVVRALSEVYR